MYLQWCKPVWVYLRFVQVHSKRAASCQGDGMCSVQSHGAANWSNESNRQGKERVNINCRRRTTGCVQTAASTCCVWVCRSVQRGKRPTARLKKKIRLATGAQQLIAQLCTCHACCSISAQARCSREMQHGAAAKRATWRCCQVR